MPQESTENTRGTCFVVMGFGKKTDFESGRTLDLDKTYRNIIKPAVEAARLNCIRADEIVHSGLIDVPMYEQLLQADVVIADLSTSNKNAFYELGVRHALRPFTTIVIAEDGIKAFPFDVNHVVVRQYHHLGEDIGYDEVIKFRNELTNAIKVIFEREPPNNDSPIYTLLRDLAPPALRLIETKAADSTSTPPELNLGDQLPAMADAVSMNVSTHNTLMEQVESAQSRGDFLTAKALLTTVRTLMHTADPNRPEDPSIIQRLALVTYKSKHPSVREALEEAKGLLAMLDPHTSNDTETLGLCGAVNKRLWEITGDSATLDEAVRAYERGFYLRNDYYNGINLAYLLNVRSANSVSRPEAVADFIQAERIRKEVVTIAEDVLKREEVPASERYWVLATLAEAHLGLGDQVKSQQTLQDAFAVASVDWMKESTQEQMTKLRQLLADSPLKYVQV